MLKCYINVHFDSIILMSEPLVTGQVTVPAGPGVFERSEGSDLVVVRWPSGRRAAINTLVVQAAVILLTHHPGTGETGQLQLTPGVRR